MKIFKNLSVVKSVMAENIKESKHVPIFFLQYTLLVGEIY